MTNIEHMFIALVPCLNLHISVVCETGLKLGNDIFLGNNFSLKTLTFHIIWHVHYNDISQRRTSYIKSSGPFLLFVKHVTDRTDIKTIFRPTKTSIQGYKKPHFSRKCLEYFLQLSLRIQGYNINTRVNI